MAVSRFIEIRSGETWASVSTLFRQWLISQSENALGWSEGNPISLDDGASLICFRIPDHHGSKISLFQEWAETTDRLYGITDGRRVVFPRKRSLAFLLPAPKEFPVPPWLQQ
jgi:hypothetical protein